MDLGANGPPGPPFYNTDQIHPNGAGSGLCRVASAGAHVCMGDQFSAQINAVFPAPAGGGGRLPIR